MGSKRVLAGGLLLILAVLTGTALLMWQEFRRTESQDRKQLELLASVMEAHASQIFDSTNLALDALAQNLAHGTHTPEELETQPAVSYNHLRTTET